MSVHGAQSSKSGLARCCGQLGATQNLIGGQTPSERNVISGNENEGVALCDPGTSYNTVLRQPHWYVRHRHGSAGSNLVSGVSLSGGASDNTIGGDSPAERNIISGNNEGNGVNFALAGHHTIR